MTLCLKSHQLKPHHSGQHCWAVAVPMFAGWTSGNDCPLPFSSRPRRGIWRCCQGMQGRGLQVAIEQLLLSALRSPTHTCYSLMRGQEADRGVVQGCGPLLGVFYYRDVLIVSLARCCRWSKILFDPLRLFFNSKGRVLELRLSYTLVGMSLKQECPSSLQMSPNYLWCMALC